MMTAQSLDGDIKIIDFGLGCHLDDRPFDGCQGIKGSMLYVPPSIIRSKKPNPRLQDVFGVGRTLLDLLLRSEASNSKHWRAKTLDDIADDSLYAKTRDHLPLYLPMAEREKPHVRALIELTHLLLTEKIQSATAALKKYNSLLYSHIIDGNRQQQKGGRRRRSRKRSKR